MFWISALALGVSATVINTNGHGGTTALSANSSNSTDNNTSKLFIRNSFDNGGSSENPVISQASDFLNTIVGFYCQSAVINQSFQNLYYQLGSVCFLLAFLAPHSPYGALWTRCMLLIGCILFTIWAQCMPDALLWMLLFLLVNFIYMAVLLCKLRPVSFEKEIEAVYVNLFKPLKVTRHQFKKVLNCMKLIRTLKFQEVYAQEKVTKVDSLSLVLSGKLVVSQSQKALHIVFPHQFLDSPEWFGVSTDDYFQVSIMAMEESRVLIWHRDKLKLSIMTEPFLQVVFDHILGRDVVKKLMQVTQVSETMAMAQSNGYISSYDDSDVKPMLKHAPGVGGGLTALINKQLQAADPNAWRLGRIEETDHETAV